MKMDTTTIINLKTKKRHTLHLAALDWENLCKGQLLSYDQVVRVYGYMNIDKTKLKVC